MRRQKTCLGLLLLGTLLATSSGCHVAYGPTLGLLAYPIPVSPYYQKRLEDEFWKRERYERVPIMGPITAGGEPVALDPPSPDEVMRALERARGVQGGVPFLQSVHRDNVRIVTEKIADYVDPPRFVPLIGPAQLHHAHYKCTIYFTETVRVGWPLPHTLRDEDTVEVVYVDHNHFHMVGAADDTLTSNY